MPRERRDVARTLAFGAALAGLLSCSSSSSPPAAAGRDGSAEDAPNSSHRDAAGCGTRGCGPSDAGSHRDSAVVGDAPALPPPPPPPDAGASAVQLTVDVARGPNRVFRPPAAPVPVSPYVYGVNSFAAWEQTTKWGLLRWGGDGQTDYNWTNNYSNAGSDYCFSQINEGGGSALAGKFTTGTPSVTTQEAIGGAALVTVPILGYVASSAVTNNVWSGSNPPCPGTPSCSGGGSPNGYADNVGGLSFETEDSSTKAFVANHATKGSTLCTTTTGSCAVDTTGPVYQDEFVNFMKVTYGGSAPVFFMLDNEPNYWPVIHPEVYPSMGTPGCGTSGTVTFDQVVTLNTTFATAVKGAWPEAKVFAPVIAQDGLLYAASYNDPNLPTPFAQYYLSKMAAASVSAGHALIDSFDTHYYTNHAMSGGGGPPSAAQCLAAPRLFWDPSFTEYSATEVGAIDFGYSNNFIESTLYPRQMIPRVLGWISDAYAGHADLAPGYSISEYNLGCEDQIEGGVAQADLLGVFGREGLFAATIWPLTAVLNGTTLVNYPIAAFDIYRNYDGAGSVVGDTTVYAATSDVADTSVYAFTSTSHAGVDLVLINKLASETPVGITVAHTPTLTTAKAYNLVTGTVGVTGVDSAPTVTCTAGGCTATYTMPATSATTLVLR